MCTATRRCSYSGGGPSRIRIALQPLQISPHLSRALIAEVAVFLQSLVDDSLHLGRHCRIQSDCGAGTGVEDGFEYLCGTACMKRESTRYHLVEYGSEGKQIIAGI